MSMVKSSLVWSLVLIGGMGCGSKENVSLSAQVVNPQIEVDSVALGAELSGGFDLRLELGAEAPEASDVSLGAFSLRREQAEIISPLPLTLEPGISFPVRVEIGQVRTLRLSFDSSSLLADTERDAICQGPLGVAGAVTDTLSAGKTTNATGPSVTPDCSVQ